MDFRKFDQTSFDATREKWRAEAETFDCFPDEIDRKLDWIRCAISKDKSAPQEQHEVMPYGVFMNGGNIAAATCELVLSSQGALNGKWLKLLKVTLSPEIETKAEDEDFAAITTAVQAYTAAMLGAYNARLTHDANTLKLFGRNNEQLKFLMTLMSVIKQDPSNASLDASRQGRWLVLKSAAPLEV